MKPAVLLLLLEGISTNEVFDMAVNKIIYADEALIDLTGDTVTEEVLMAGYTAHRSDGTQIVGTAFEGLPDEYIFNQNGTEIVYRKV